jgi:hypothetical protein
MLLACEDGGRAQEQRNLESFSKLEEVRKKIFS